MADRTSRGAAAAVITLMSPRGSRETGLVQEMFPVWLFPDSCEIEVPAQGHRAVASLLAVVDPDALAESWEEHEAEKSPSQACVLFCLESRLSRPGAGQASLNLFLF